MSGTQATQAAASQATQSTQASQASQASQATQATEAYQGLMRGVIPYVNLGGRSGEAADFYARAFGAGDLGRMPLPDAPGRYMHLQVEINGGVLMMTDHGGDGYEAGLRNVHMQLVVDDGRRWWERAVSAGCRILAPYEMQFWGDEWGLLEDPFGIQWAVLQPGPERGVQGDGATSVEVRP
jgi:PhnB protein